MARARCLVAPPRHPDTQGFANRPDILVSCVSWWWIELVAAGRPHLLRTAGRPHNTAMRAMVLEHPAPVEQAPLALRDLPIPEPGPSEIRVRVRPLRRLSHRSARRRGRAAAAQRARIVPGHQVVGSVDALGAGCRRFALGQRVGIAWLRSTCGVCDSAGAATRTSARRRASPATTPTAATPSTPWCAKTSPTRCPTSIADAEASPLLCAGIIGYRALRRAEIRRGCRLGLYGFGASAHIAIQVARHLGCRVFVMTREARHRHLADGARRRVGRRRDRREPPEKLDSAVLFAPAGELVPTALDALDRGGTLALAGIYLSQIPPLDYERASLLRAHAAQRHRQHAARRRGAAAHRRRDSDPAAHAPLPARPTRTARCSSSSTTASRARPCCTSAESADPLGELSDHFVAEARDALAQRALGGERPVRDQSVHAEIGEALDGVEVERTARRDADLELAELGPARGCSAARRRAGRRGTPPCRRCRAQTRTSRCRG